MVGAFAFLPPKFDPTTAYLMSDFPVSWTRYRRLAKLIVMAAVHERGAAAAPALPVEAAHRLGDAAFTDRPNSAKYGRGIPGVQAAEAQRADSKGGDGIHRYQLQYGGPLGDLRPRRGPDLWKRRHGKDMR